MLYLYREAWYFLPFFVCCCSLHLKGPVSSCTFFTTTSSYSFPQCPRHQPHHASSASLLSFITAYLYDSYICVCECVLYTQTHQSMKILSNLMAFLKNASLRRHLKINIIIRIVTFLTFTNSFTVS